MAVYVYVTKDGKIGSRLFEFKGHLSTVVACQFAADATSLVSASLDTRVNIWDCLTGQLRQTLCHAYPVPQFIFGQAQVRSIGVTRFGVSILTMTDEKKLQVPIL
jgi:WD40 repeat protein